MIRFVYFDLGGVTILDITDRPERWEALKRGIGVTPEKDEEFEKFLDKHEPELHVGRDAATLIPLMEQEFNLKLPKNYSLVTDIVNRFEPNKAIWPVIKEIHKECKIGLLTNMYPHMLEAIRKRGLLPDVEFDVIIDSTVEHVRKPEKAIFELAQKRSGIESSKILFVDNSPAYVAGAGRAGFQTFLYNQLKPAESSSKLLAYFENNKA